MSTQPPDHLLAALYIRCMNCAVPDGVCDGIKRVPSEGWVPRGFSPATPPVEILYVAKNPGHPFEAEINAFRGKRGRALYDAYVGMSSTLFSQAKGKDVRSKGFPRRLTEYLSLILDRPPEAIAGLVAGTNLVKCSTEDERAILTDAAKHTCFTNYLKQEISAYRPKVLLALGREVERFLLSVQDQHQLPVLYVYHPSWPMPRDGKAEWFAELRRRYLEACDAHASG